MSNLAETFTPQNSYYSYHSHINLPLSLLSDPLTQSCLTPPPLIMYTLHLLLISHLPYIASFSN